MSIEKSIDQLTSAIKELCEKLGATTCSVVTSGSGFSDSIKDFDAVEEVETGETKKTETKKKSETKKSEVKKQTKAKEEPKEESKEEATSDALSALESELLDDPKEDREPITLDTLREKVLKLIDADNQEGVLGALSKIGANKLSEIPEEQYEEFYALLEELG